MMKKGIEYKSETKKDNMEQNKPKEKDEMDRREFLQKGAKALGGLAVLGFGISQLADKPTSTELKKWEIEQSVKNWEALQNEIIRQVKNSIDYLDIMSIDDVVHSSKEDMERENSSPGITTTDSDSFYKDLYIKDRELAHQSYADILKLISEVQNFKLYRGYLRAFAYYINTEKEKALNTKKLHEKFILLRYLSIRVEQFLNNIICTKKMEEEYNISVTGENTKFFLADIKSVYEALTVLPHFAIKKSRFEKFTLKELDPGVGAQMGRSEMSGEFKKWDPNASYAYHELTHSFDEYVEKGWDSPGWLNLNRNARPYKYKSGREAIEAEKQNNEGYYTEEQNIPGYARAYGWKGNILEDKATINEALFIHYNLKDLVKRCLKDPILKTKVEFMTGYRLDNNMPEKDMDELDKMEIDLGMISSQLYNFGTPLTEKDYQNAGFPGFCYWPIWSRDEQGKTWMDAKYFNAILAGKEVKFLNENGRTIREIT